jgi:hypothetical protein
VAASSGKRAVPAIAREAFTMPDGSGDVFVVAMRLTERLALRREVAACKPKDDDEALEHTLPRLLGRAVVDADGKPVFTAQEWADWSATYPTAALELFNAASRLSSLTRQVAEKNSEASPS